ncbi:MAG: DUF1059 domain-containing protein [Mesorhizobium sp.]|nr:MAG: DUF1059 domain-containing protein [Mesorhizobium sp.]RWI44309.1 MAG: DUF1059 domain-containing protein [Mesorhizobium sp.]RWJ25269.1 MAG: DUF1059 domain-containing protein [Mesorhizobium sp.]RWJ89686.1 MAG: DUF1059 domain-containing protein [Mesorhizobium sp.]RWK15055.1 MAG: DUF1059 domain-containing protein [Mesorhizobium sp.]
MVRQFRCRAVAMDCSTHFRTPGA